MELRFELSRMKTERSRIVKPRQLRMQKIAGGGKWDIFCRSREARKKSRCYQRGKSIPCQAYRNSESGAR
jgi:hypothetical protein